MLSRKLRNNNWCLFLYRKLLGDKIMFDQNIRKSILVFKICTFLIYKIIFATCIWLERIPFKSVYFRMFSAYFMRQYLMQYLKTYSYKTWHTTYGSGMIIANEAFYVVLVHKWTEMTLICLIGKPHLQ